MAEAEKPDLTILTVNLLSAYVTNNNVPSNELADLIRSTRAALESDAAQEARVETAYEPAVSVRKSRASRDHLISLIDGKTYKTLRRHLAAHGLTPAQYRERYKLPDDYPMVAPAYSDHRRAVAQRLGLGRKKQDAAGPVMEKPAPETPATTPPIAAAAKPAGKAKSQRKTRRAAQKAPAARKSSVAASEKAEDISAKTRKPRARKLSLFNAASAEPASKEPSGRQRRKAASTSTAAKQERAAPDDKASPTAAAE